jgi:cytochrome c7-like protein
MDDDRRDDSPARKPGGVRLRYRDFEHVLRMAGVFLAAIALFLVWRAWAVPADFGKYGHFRAGALADAASRTPVYAGRAACIECHGDVEQARQGGKHGQIGCEACHGPLGRHARVETDVAPVRPSTRGVCVTCHTARQGKPRSFPQVVVQEHASAGPCTDCHQAHKPDVT